MKVKMACIFAKIFSYYLNNLEIAYNYYIIKKNNFFFNWEKSNCFLHKRQRFRVKYIVYYQRRGFKLLTFKL